MKEEDLKFLSLIAPTEETAPVIQGIYAISNRTNGRKYIGSSIDIHYRHKEHLRLLRKGSHHNTHLQNAFVRYGEANFQLILIETVARRSDLCAVEQSYLNHETDLYNIAPFADRPTRRGKPHSAETKAKIGTANRLALRGNKIPPHVTAKRVAKVIGQKRTPETRARMRIAQRGRIPWAAIVIGAALKRGRPLAPEHRLKISASMKRHVRTPEHLANMSRSQKGRPKSPEAVAAMIAARWTPEARAKASSAQKGIVPIKVLLALRMIEESDLRFLSLVGSTESTSFNELCSQLGDDCPEDKGGWRELFQKIRDLERQCYIEVTRTAGKIDGLMLTESGAALIRDRLDAQRGLLSQMQRK